MAGQVPGGWDLASRVVKVDAPSKLVPVRLYSLVNAPNCIVIVLGAEVLENDIITGTCCTYTLATPRLSISATVVVRVPTRFHKLPPCGEEIVTTFGSPSPIQAATDTPKRSRSCIIC